MGEYYRYVIVESYVHSGGGSKHAIRARPLPGQGLSPAMAVECSSRMRTSHPVGTLFKIYARIKDTDQSPHLYTSWQWGYTVVTADEADRFVELKQWGES